MENIYPVTDTEIDLNFLPFRQPLVLQNSLLLDQRLSLHVFEKGVVSQLFSSGVSIQAEELCVPLVVDHARATTLRACLIYMDEHMRNHTLTTDEGQVRRNEDETDDSRMMTNCLLT